MKRSSFTKLRVRPATACNVHLQAILCLPEIFNSLLLNFQRLTEICKVKRRENIFWDSVLNALGVGTSLIS